MINDVTDKVKEIWDKFWILAANHPSNFEMEQSKWWLSIEISQLQKYGTFNFKIWRIMIEEVSSTNTIHSIPYSHHYNPLLIRNHSWILTIQKARILRKKLLKKSFLTFKKWVEKIQTTGYNGTSTKYNKVFIYQWRKNFTRCLLLWRHHET